MTTKIKNRYIFDLDGTLYHFPKGTFRSSGLFDVINKRINLFFQEKFKLSPQKAQETLNHLNKNYPESTSIAVEKEFGVNRYEYFNYTWDIQPEKYLQKNEQLVELFTNLEGRVAILTAAPRIWAERALRQLGIYQFVEGSIFTGEPDLRKPNPGIFKKVAQHLGVSSSQIISIGDQEFSDILPAKKIGMRTIIVGRESQNADYCVKNIEGYIKIIRGLENETKNNN